MWNEVKEAWRYRAVVQNFVRTSLAVRYRRSVLGYFWSVLSPLMKYAIMGFVFDIIGRFAMPNYYGFMFVGSVFFGYISTVVQVSTTAFISNENYIKKIYVPKLVFVLNIVVLESVNFLLILAAILALLTLMGQVTPSWEWLGILLAFVPTLLFLTGGAVMIALATIYFRDLQHLTEIVFQALLFATPILYPAALIQKDANLAWVLDINPLYYFVTLFRNFLVDNKFPSWETWTICLTMGTLCFLSGLILLRKFNNRIIFKL